MQQVSANYCPTFLFPPCGPAFRTVTNFPGTNSTASWFSAEGKGQQVRWLLFHGPNCCILSSSHLSIPSSFRTSFKGTVVVCNTSPGSLAKTSSACRPHILITRLFLGIPDREKIIFRTVFFPLKPLDISPTNFPERLCGGNNI